MSADTVVLAISAHPDDEIMCAGTLARLAGIGVPVHLLIVTDGQYGAEGAPETVGAQRLAEAEASADMLGVASVHALHRLDGHVENTADLRYEIVREVRRRHANLLMTHHLSDYHPDHRNVAYAVSDAYTLSVLDIDAGEPLAEHPHLVHWDDQFANWRPDVRVNVTGTINVRHAAASCYRSQGTLPDGRDFVAVTDIPALKRGVERRCAYAEGFTGPAGTTFDDDGGIRRLIHLLGGD